MVKFSLLIEIHKFDGWRWFDNLLMNFFKECVSFSKQNFNPTFTFRSVGHRQVFTVFWRSS